MLSLGFCCAVVHERAIGCAVGGEERLSFGVRLGLGVGVDEGAGRERGIGKDRIRKDGTAPRGCREFIDDCNLSNTTIKYSLKVMSVG